MADKPKSVACVRDLRDAPLEEFRLPDDKRQWKPLARNRQSLANFLATFADRDGSRIFPHVETMTKHFGWSRSTTFRLLADLRALKLLSETVGLHGFRGPAVRKMDVATFREGVSNSKVGVSKSDEKESQSQSIGVSKSEVGVSKSRVGVSGSVRHIPPLYTDTETATTATKSTTEQQAGGWKLLEEKHSAEIGYFGRRSSDFQKHIDDFGFDIVDSAVKAALDEGNLDNAKSAPGIILHRLGKTLAAEVKLRARAAEQKKEAAFQEESIERQTQEIILRRDRRPVNEMSLEDFLK